MKIKSLKCALWMLGLLAVAQICRATADASFHAGVIAYEAGQFDLASRGFSDSLVGHAGSGTLVNLGLANWRGRRTGEAMLAWERANWLDPFNGAASENLLYARETTAVNPPELTWFEQASTWLPANWWTWFAGGSLWLAVALVTLPGFFRVRKAGWHQTVSALALGIFLLSLAPSIGIVTRSNVGVVLENNTMLRLTPTQSAEEIAVLPPGETVRVLRQRKSYLLVRTQNGNGWVERRSIGLVVPQ